MFRQITFTQKTIDTWRMVEYVDGVAETAKLVTPEQAFRRMTELKNEGFKMAATSTAKWYSYQL